MSKEELITQLEQQVKLNEEMISSLKEFFGTYLSNFLKQYRNQEQPNEKLNKILQRQDGIYQKFHELMKECWVVSKDSEKIILELKDKIIHQQGIITILREFFSSNSTFIKLYRKNSPELYPEMNTLLDKQEVIFQKLESAMKS